MVRFCFISALVIYSILTSYGYLELHTENTSLRKLLVYSKKECIQYKLLSQEVIQVLGMVQGEIGV